MEEITTAAAARTLRYLEANQWLPLPDWASYFLLLGSALASPAKNGTRLIAAVSVPTRGYAAAFIATGIVMRRFQDPLEDETLSHLAYLRSLPEGTTVTYRRGLTGSVMAKGRLVGCIVENGTEFIRIRDSQNSYHLVPSHRALFVQPAEAALDTLPRMVRQRSVSPLGGLARFMPVNEALSRFVQHSRLNCLIVGVKTVLHGEIVDTHFAIETRQGKLVEGSLQDILGVREFGKESDIHHSRILASSSRATNRPFSLDSTFVIFDGARSLLRWRSAWPNASWIFVGDRTGRRFDEAASIVDEHYVSPRRISIIEDDELPSPPAGIESIVFRTRPNP